MSELHERARRVQQLLDEDLRLKGDGPDSYSAEERAGDMLADLLHYMLEHNMNPFGRISSALGHVSSETDVQTSPPFGRELFGEAAMLMDDYAHRLQPILDKRRKNGPLRNGR